MAEISMLCNVKIQIKIEDLEGGLIILILQLKNKIEIYKKIWMIKIINDYLNLA